MSIKRQRIFSAVLLALALVMLIGVKTFLQPCVHEDGSAGSCHWAGEAVFAVAVALAAQAALSFIIAGDRARFGVVGAMLPTALAAVLLPGGLIDLCMMETMRCNAVMKPGVRIFGVVILVIAVIDIVTNGQNKEKQR